MHDEFDYSREEEEIRSENDFLKMKMMLEQGARFGSMGEMELPAEVENAFLKEIIAFEEKFKNKKRVKVFDKIGQPRHFKPIQEIPDSGINKAWEELHTYLNDYGINLDTRSPNITEKELYRFTIEELFLEEIDDIDMPGLTVSFTYDEFYPDLVYENECTVREWLLEAIFSKDPILAEYPFSWRGFSFNEKPFKEIDPFKNAVVRFKSFFDEIILDECLVTSSVAGETNGWVKGTYRATASMELKKIVYEGDFLVELIPDEDTGYWVMNKIQVNGLEL